MDRVFISYRRDDTAGVAGRLRDRLSALLGQNAVFLDTDDIDGGDQFRLRIANAIERSTVVIVLIGARWLGPDGANRLLDAHDSIRMEMAIAFKLRRRVIPVLIDSRLMPTRVDLPDDVKELVDINALVLRNSRFDEDLAHLIERLLVPPITIAVGPRANWGTKSLTAGLLALGLWTLDFAWPGTGRWGTASAALKGLTVLCTTLTLGLAFQGIRENTVFGLRGAPVGTYALGIGILSAVNLAVTSLPTDPLVHFLLQAPLLLLVAYLLWRKRTAWKLDWWRRATWR